MTKHVAIAGAGLGGLRAAEQLRAAGHTGPVTVIGAEPHMPYSRPPLSKELLAHELADAEATPETNTDDLAALHERVAFRRRASVADVTFRLGVPVTAADLDAGELVLADGGAVRFDGLVVATGLRPRRLDVPGPEGPGSGRHVLRTLDDCASLRAGLRALIFRGDAQSSRARSGAGSSRPRVVVVGAGFVGSEVACTALALGCDVTVVEPAGPPMFRVLGERLAVAVQRAHERAGLAFVLGRAVTGYTGDDRVSGVVLAGDVLPADLVVEAIGSLPNTEWLAGTGLDLTDGVLCDNGLSAVAGAGTRGSATGVPVTAVGDVARFPNPLFDDVPRRVEHWSMPTDTAPRAAATLQARLAGDQIDQKPFVPLPYFWSDQGDLRMQSFGSPGLADEVVIAEGDPDALDKGLVATYHRGGRLVGSVAFNVPPRRYRALREALLA